MVVSYYTFGNSKSRGVSDTVQKNLTYAIINTKTDQHVRFLFIKMSLSHRMVIAAKAYFSNQGQTEFTSSMLKELKYFVNSLPIIQGGDLNLQLDTSLNTSSGRSSLSYGRFVDLRDTSHAYNLWTSGWFFTLHLRTLRSSQMSTTRMITQNIFSSAICSWTCPPQQEQNPCFLTMPRFGLPFYRGAQRLDALFCLGKEFSRGYTAVANAP